MLAREQAALVVGVADVSVVLPQGVVFGHEDPVAPLGLGGGAGAEVGRRPAHGDELAGEGDGRRVGLGGLEVGRRRVLDVDGAAGGDVVVLVVGLEHVVAWMANGASVGLDQDVPFALGVLGQCDGHGVDVAVAWGEVAGVLGGAQVPVVAPDQVAREVDLIVPGGRRGGACAGVGDLPLDDDFLLGEGGGWRRDPDDLEIGELADRDVDGVGVHARVVVLVVVLVDVERRVGLDDRIAHAVEIPFQRDGLPAGDRFPRLEGLAEAVPGVADGVGALWVVGEVDPVVPAAFGRGGALVGDGPLDPDVAVRDGLVGCLDVGDDEVGQRRHLEVDGRAVGVVRLVALHHGEGRLVGLHDDMVVARCQCRGEREGERHGLGVALARLEREGGRGVGLGQGPVDAAVVDVVGREDDMVDPEDGRRVVAHVADSVGHVDRVAEHHPLGCERRVLDHEVGGDGQGGHVVGLVALELLAVAVGDHQHEHVADGHINGALHRVVGGCGEGQVLRGVVGNEQGVVVRVPLVVGRHVDVVRPLERGVAAARVRHGPFQVELAAHAHDHGVHAAIDREIGQWRVGDLDGRIVGVVVLGQLEHVVEAVAHYDDVVLPLGPPRLERQVGRLGLRVGLPRGEWDGGAGGDREQLVVADVPHRVVGEVDACLPGRHGVGVARVADGPGHVEGVAEVRRGIHRHRVVGREVGADQLDDDLVLVAALAVRPVLVLVHLVAGQVEEVGADLHRVGAQLELLVEVHRHLAARHGHVGDRAPDRLAVGPPERVDEALVHARGVDVLAEREGDVVEGRRGLRAGDVRHHVGARPVHGERACERLARLALEVGEGAGGEGVGVVALDVGHRHGEAHGVAVEQLDAVGRPDAVDDERGGVEQVRADAFGEGEDDGGGCVLLARAVGGRRGDHGGRRVGLGGGARDVERVGAPRDAVGRHPHRVEAAGGGGEAELAVGRAVVVGHRRTCLVEHPHDGVEVVGGLAGAFARHGRGDLHGVAGIHRHGVAIGVVHADAQVVEEHLVAAAAAGQDVGDLGLVTLDGHRRDFADGRVALAPQRAQQVAVGVVGLQVAAVVGESGDEVERHRVDGLAEVGPQPPEAFAPVGVAIACEHLAAGGRVVGGLGRHRVGLAVHRQGDSRHGVGQVGAVGEIVGLHVAGRRVEMAQGAPCELEQLGLGKLVVWLDVELAVAHDHQRVAGLAPLRAAHAEDAGAGGRGPERADRVVHVA